MTTEATNSCGTSPVSLCLTIIERRQHGRGEPYVQLPVLGGAFTKSPQPRHRRSTCRSCGAGDP